MFDVGRIGQSVQPVFDVSETFPQKRLFSPRFLPQFDASSPVVLFRGYPHLPPYLLVAISDEFSTGLSPLKRNYQNPTRTQQKSIRKIRFNISIWN